MASIDLSGSPYFDDSSERESQHYRVLFRPGRTVQVRELNELQALLQKQIERFGDSIYTKGTIIDGCNFTFHDVYPYAKLSDNDTSGIAIDIDAYQGLIARNQDGLSAQVINTLEGLESDAPNLHTIYLKYRDSGSDANSETFAAGDVLKFSDITEKLYSVKVDSAGVGFSNSEAVVFTPQLVVNVTTGSFTNGEYVTQPSLGSNLQIVNIDTTLRADDGHVVLTLKPRDVDLANSSANSSAWSVEANSSIRNSGNTAVASVIELLGSGAKGEIVTDASGRVTSVVLTEGGEGYEVIPNVRVRSPNNSVGLSSLLLTAKNYLAEVRVANVASATGNGYAFGITRGIIYQKGFFVEAEEQVIVVSRYDQAPSNVAVGFDTVPSFVTSNEDTRLLDNVTGEANELAPGADRLKLTPTLVLLSKEEAAANTDFLALVEWSDGNPYLQRREAVYSRIGEEFMRRTAETSGDFVIDQFQITTTSPSNTSLEGSHHSIVIDPGTAYVLGKRVETLGNYSTDLPKSTTTKNARAAFGLKYGPYVRVNEVAGLFQHATGAEVELWTGARNFLSDTDAGTSTSIGTLGSKIGTARVRSMVRESGVPGDPGAVYRLYLFHIKMNPGRNFRDVRTIYYNGTYEGSADIVLETDPTTQKVKAELYQRGNTALVFHSGHDSIQAVQSANYFYRTIDQTITFANTGQASKTLTAPGEEYPWAGELSAAEASDLYVVPIANSLTFSANLTGTVTLNTTSANLVGSGTSFLTELAAGDWVKPYTNSTNFDVRRVTKVVNNTLVVLDANGASAFSGVNFKRTFPRFMPIPFGVRSGLTANVDALGTTLTLDLGETLEGTGTVNTALGVTIKRVDPDPVTKTAVRQRYVKLCLANNAGGTNGPWCLGVPDAVRLRNVYRSSANTVNVNSTRVTDAFFLDPNQNEDFYDLSFLYRRPRGNYRTKASDWLLVEFDYLTRPDDGYFTYQSYTATTNVETLTTLDSQPLGNLTTALASIEIPEVPMRDGKRLDLISAIDFRPACANTVAPAATTGAAPINPTYTVAFGNTADPANDKRFPLPSSAFRAQVAIFETRYDSVYLYGDAPNVVMGEPARSRSAAIVPTIPLRSMRLYDIEVPPYPSFPLNRSQQLGRVANTLRVGDKRLGERVAKSITTEEQTERYQPRRYTMRDINSLEKRIRALEYYTTLSLTETQVFKKSIPSSVDPTLDRFKYGFFVDSFSDTSLQSDADPHYAARIEESQLLTPSTLQIFPQYQGGILHPNYVDHTVISQTYATEKDDATPPEETPPEETPPDDEETPPKPKPTEPIWEGTMVARVSTMSATAQFGPIYDPYGAATVHFTGIVDIDCYGLKPRTRHYLYPMHPFEDRLPKTEQTEVRQFNKDWEDPLVTEADGTFGRPGLSFLTKTGMLQARLDITVHKPPGVPLAQAVAQQMKQIEFVVRSPQRASLAGNPDKNPQAVSWARAVPVLSYRYTVCHVEYGWDKPFDELTPADWQSILTSWGIYPGFSVIK